MGVGRGPGPLRNAGIGSPGCLLWVKTRPYATKFNFRYTPESGLKSDIAVRMTPVRRS